MSKCPRRLTKGQYKQIPDKQGFDPIGYYIACPLCGYRCIIVLVEDGAKEVGGRLTAGEVRCAKCKGKGKVADGEFVAA